mmetsp:Transcript_27124/g.41547  ORF Transcript_27124/g.41547 Transcript_27124/m.41547 type:complete len:367 (+) Transcript_27124:27-1127(+)
MIDGTDTYVKADVGANTSSSGIQPMSLETDGNATFEDIPLREKKEIYGHIKKCSEEFEANPLKPLIVFTNVQHPETALHFWDEAGHGNLVMVTSNNELVIYELVSDIHESITGEVTFAFRDYLRHIQSNNDDIDIDRFICYVGAGRVNGKEADSRFRAIKEYKSRDEKLKYRSTVVIEVGWSQKLYSTDGTSLIDKGKQWIDDDEVSVVVLVKLYDGCGKNDEKLGMLVCLMDNTKRIYKAVTYGEINNADETYLEGIEVDIERSNGLLKIDGHLVFGMGENPDENLEALLTTFGDDTPADYIENKEAVKATLDWVREKQADNGKIPEVEINLKKLFGFLKETHKEQKQDKGQDQKKTPAKRSRKE